MNFGSAFACMTLLAQRVVATGQCSVAAEVRRQSSRSLGMKPVIVQAFSSQHLGSRSACAGCVDCCQSHGNHIRLGCVSLDLFAMTLHRVCRLSGCARWGCWEKVCTVRSTWFPPTSQSLHTQMKGRTSGLRARENFQARSAPLLNFLSLRRYSMPSIQHAFDTACLRYSMLLIST